MIWWLERDMGQIVMQCLFTAIGCFNVTTISIFLTITFEIFQHKEIRNYTKNRLDLKTIWHLIFKQWCTLILQPRHFWSITVEYANMSLGWPSKRTEKLNTFKILHLGISMRYTDSISKCHFKRVKSEKLINYDFLANFLGSKMAMTNQITCQEKWQRL